MESANIRKSLSTSKALYVLLLIYVSGLIGIFSSSSDWFLQFTPLNLIISAFFVLLYFEKKDLNLFITFFLVSIAGYAIEAIGVATGWPFGSYSYGEVLGIKVLGVPLMIGINWGMLAFACASVAKSLVSNKYKASLIGASFMVLLDFVMEPTAIVYGFWNWEAVSIPVTNYLAWFTISYVLILFINFRVKDLTNSLALPFLIIQFCFFSALSFTNMTFVLYSAVTIGTFFFMEFMAWFTHKYVMHGFLWLLHKDHHNPHPGFFEKNDAFFMIFAVPSATFFILGSMDGIDYRFFIGLGILLYGFAYFFVHDLFIHQRVKVLTKTKNPYLRALRKAHKVHHKHLNKEHGECFGMLIVPKKFVDEALQDQKKL